MEKFQITNPPKLGSPVNQPHESPICSFTLPDILIEVLHFMFSQTRILGISADHSVPLLNDLDTDSNPS